MMLKTEIKIRYNGKPKSKEQMEAIYAKKRDKLSRAISPAMKKVSVMLDTWVQKNFQTEGLPVGGWADIERNGMILQDTGTLRLSFIPFSSKNDAGIGSDLPYAIVHEKGLGVTKRRILPQRKDVIKQAHKIIKGTLITAGK